MKEPVFNVLIVLIMLCASNALRAQGIPVDSSVVQVRGPETAALEAVRRDGTFRYDRQPVEEVSLWDVVRRRFEEVIETIYSVRALRPFWDFLPYLLAGLTIFYVLLRLMKSNVRGLFYSRGRVAPTYTVSEADLTVDFDARITEAVANGQYREAVRLHYLKALRLLNEQGLIRWQRDKTNRIYLREVQSPALKGPFREVTRWFEYIWYGDHPIDPALFQTVSSAFEQFEGRIQTNIT